MRATRSPSRMQRVRSRCSCRTAPQQMFDLVDDVERYLQVPAMVRRRDGARATRATARRRASTSTITACSAHFTTDNVNVPPESIVITLKDGPFKHLHGEWRFRALADDACKVEFELAYEFATARCSRRWWARCSTTSRTRSSTRSCDAPRSCSAMKMNVARRLRRTGRHRRWSTSRLRTARASRDALAASGIVARLASVRGSVELCDPSGSARARRYAASPTVTGSELLRPLVADAKAARRARAAERPLPATRPHGRAGADSHANSIGDYHSYLFLYVADFTGWQRQDLPRQSAHAYLRPMRCRSLAAIVALLRLAQSPVATGQPQSLVGQAKSARRGRSGRCLARRAGPRGVRVRADRRRLPVRRRIARERARLQRPGSSRVPAGDRRHAAATSKDMSRIGGRSPGPTLSPATSCSSTRDASRSRTSASTSATTASSTRRAGGARSRSRTSTAATGRSASTARGGWSDVRAFARAAG